MISQRLRGIDEDGEAIEGLAPKLQKAFKEYANIDIQDQNGELRSTYDILSDLAEVYPTLTSKEKQYLGELAAGNRQVKVLNSIVSNWNDVQQAVEAATNSVGSAEQENAAFMDSIQGRLNELQSTFQEFSANMISADVVKFIIDFGIGALDLIDTLGGLQTILIAVSGVLIAKYGAGAAKSVAGFFESISKTVVALIDNFKAGKAEGMGFFDSLVNAAGITKAGLAIGAITTGLTALSITISAVQKAEEERRQAAIQAGETAKAQSDKIFELSTQYLSLSEAVKTDASAKSDLIQVQKELIDNLGAEKAGIDGVTKSLQQQTIEQLKANHATLLAAAEAKKQNVEDIGSWSKLLYGQEGTTIEDRTVAEGILAKNQIKYDENLGGWVLPGDPSTIDGATERVQKLRQAISDMVDTLGTSDASKNSVFQFLSSQLNELEPSLTDYQNFIDKEVNQSAAKIQIYEKMGSVLPKSEVEFEKFKQDLIESAKASETFQGSQEDIESAIDSVLATMPEFSEYMGETDTTMEAMTETAEEASQSLEDMTNTVNSLKEILANFAENGTFSAEDLNTLIELDPNLEDDVYRYLGGLQSAEELVEAIKQSSKEAESLYRDNVLDKLWPDIAKQKQIVNTMSRLYALDAENYTSMEEAKAAVKMQVESQKWLDSSASVSDFVNLYLADFQNYSEFEQAKSEIADGVLTQIQGLSADQIIRLATQYGVDLSNFADVEGRKPEIAALIASKLIQTYGVVDEAQKQSLQNQLAILEQQRSIIARQTYNPNLIGPQMDNVTKNFKLDELDQQISNLKNVINSSNSYDKNSFLAQLQEVLDGIDVTLPETSDLLKDTEDAAKDAGNAASDAAQKALDDLQDLNDELQNSLDELNNDRENIESLVDTVMSMLKQRYDDELDRLDELIEKQEEQRDKEIEALEAETKAYTDKIDAQLESLRAKEDEKKFNDELAEKSKDLADLQAELLALQLDDSDYGKKKRLELEEEIAEKTKELDEFQHDHSVELQEDALEKEKENAEDALESKKEELEAEYQATIDYYEQQRDALEAYLNTEWGLRQEAYRLINKGGQQLYEDLIEYNRNYGNAVDADVKQQWDKAYASLNKYNDGQINVRSTLEKIASSAVTLQNKIDALAPKIETARQKADSLKSSLDKSTSAVGNTISKVNSLTSSLNKAKDAADSIKIPNPATGGGKGSQSVSRYASGRTGGASEWAIVDEAGAELITRQRGRLTYLESGDGVVPNDITERLLALGENPTKYMSAVMSGVVSSVRPQSNVTNVPVHVEYGDIIVQGKADQATVRDIARLLESNGEALAKVVYKATKKSAMRQGYGL